MGLLVEQVRLLEQLLGVPAVGWDQLLGEPAVDFDQLVDWDRGDRLLLADLGVGFAGFQSFKKGILSIHYNGARNLFRFLPELLFLRLHDVLANRSSLSCF